MDSLTIMDDRVSFGERTMGGGGGYPAGRVCVCVQSAQCRSGVSEEGDCSSDGNCEGRTERRKGFTVHSSTRRRRRRGYPGTRCSSPAPTPMASVPAAAARSLTLYDPYYPIRGGREGQREGRGTLRKRKRPATASQPQVLKPCSLRPHVWVLSI